jgi:hypothetical protein
MRPLVAGLLAGALLSCSPVSSHAETSLVSLSPADGVTNVCTDTSLRITFKTPPSMGAKGKISVIRDSDKSAVDVLDLSASVFTNTVGGKLFTNVPISIDGNSVSIQLHSHALAPSETYHVTIDPGAFKGGDGNDAPGIGIGNPTGWSFSTRPAMPPNCRDLTVAPDGSGDFCSVQGAVDYVSDDNQFPVRIYIRKGVYTGIVYLGQGKNNLHFVGEDRKESIIQGVNNNILNRGRVVRSLFGIDANDCSVENLTIHNTTPYKGSQAEALRVNGDRCILSNDDFRSYQDTLLLSGRIYLTNCYVEGDVDFIWGEGITFFNNCEIKTLHNGYYVQSRNPTGNPGYVFLNCKLTASPGTEHCWLARIESERFPFSSVAYINCSMGPQVPDAGWEIKGTNTAHLNFTEFHSKDLSGNPLQVSQRIPASRQLSDAEAAKLSDPKTVFSIGDSWDPTTR